MSTTSRRVPSISIRYALPGLLAILIIAAVGLTGVLAFRSGQQAVDDLATRLSQEITVRIEEHVQSFMEIPHLFHQINTAAVRAGVLDLKNYDEVERYFWQLVQITESVPYVYMGTETDDFLGVDSSYGDAGEIVFKIRDAESAPARVTYSLDAGGNRLEEIERKDYFPTERPWYTSAVEAGRATWPPIYQFAARPILGISPVAPVYDESGDVFGVLGIDLTLAELSDFLRSLNISPNGQAFIIEHNGDMVATSAEEPPFVTNEEGEQARLNVADSEDPVIRATVQHLLGEFGSFDQIESSRQLTFDIDGERHFVQVAPLRDERGLDWLTVVIIPARDFMGPVYDNARTTVLLGVLVLVVAAAVGFVLARYIIRPVLVVSDVAAAIEAEQYDLGPLDDVAGRTDELGRLARVFQRMAREVYAREQRLKEQVQQLRIEVDEAKKKEQVSEIVESDFFQDLQVKARQMRRTRRKKEED